MPPKTGWLFYLDEKWRDAEALCVTVNVWDNEGISKECSKYKQKGIHNPNKTKVESVKLEKAFDFKIRL